MSTQKNQPTVPTEGRQIRVALNSAQMTTSYANVFQTRCTAEEIVLCCGLSLPENLNKPDAADGADEELLAVDLDRRIVMNSASARRLLLALDRVLKEQAALAAR